MINVNELKQKIITFLDANGPSIPVKIAKEIKQEPVFASALLGELTQSQKVIASNMKVGASRIYLLPGQEQMLESYADEYLSGFHKKAYLQLKEQKYLTDTNQEPAMRVALREIKDFASPFKHQEQVLWRYNFTPVQEISVLLNGTSTNDNNTNQEVPEENPERQSESEPQEEISEPEQKEEQDGEELENEIEPIFEKKEEPQPKETQATLDNKEEEKSEPKKKQSGSFSSEVTLYLESQDLTIIEEIEESRNEFVCTVQVNTDIGEIEYLVIARNKKTINDADLRVAKSRANEKNMPCYLLHKGKLTKNAQTFLEEVKNLVTVGKID